MDQNTQYTFISAGEPGQPPAGQYLVTVFPSGDAELAWRSEPRASIVWGRPAYGERA